jgi:hypothetical protein
MKDTVFLKWLYNETRGVAAQHLLLLSVQFLEEKYSAGIFR